MTEQDELEALVDSCELCEYCYCTDYGSWKPNTSQHTLCEGAGCSDAYDRYKEDEEEETMSDVPEVNRVIYSGAATVVIWKDGTKTVVRQAKGDDYDRVKGFLVAFYQKATGKSKKKTSEFFSELWCEG